MAASVPAKPTEIGARRDDAPASDVVRRISSYGNTCGDSERYPKNSQNPCRLERAMAPEPNRCPALPKRCPRAARVLPERCPPGRPRSADASASKVDQWWGEHP